MSRPIALSNSTDPQVGSDAWVDSCFDTMRERASGGQSFAASDFFRDELSESTCVDLIYAEYVLKENTDDFDVEQFISRYARFEQALRRQLNFDSALSETQDSHPGQVIPAGVPQSIGKFQILEALSAGAQAAVFRAIHPDLKCEVVVKHYKKSASQSADFSEAIREGQCLASLNHPGLSQVMDVGIHDEAPYLVTRLIKGETLHAYAGAKRPDYRESCRIVSQIAGAISQAHAQGIVHLDLKPSNIVMDADSNPHIIDFGLAAYRQPYKWDHLPEGSIRGTLLYMAPEQAQGDSHQIDHQSDVFSLGAILYFLCVGKPPYANTRSMETLRQIQNAQWIQEPLDELPVPEALKQAIRRALALDKRERFGSARELANELDKIPGTPPVSGVRPTRSFIIVVAAVVSLLFMAGLFWKPASSPLCQAQAELEIKVLRDGKYFSLPECAPLRTGEHLRVSASVPPGHHAALYVHQADGNFRQLAVKSAQSKATTIAYPEAADELVPLTGPSGTEMIIVCLSHKPIGAQQSPAPIDLPAIDSLTVMAAGDQKVAVIQQTRDIGEPVKNSQGPDLQAVLDKYCESMASQVDHFQSLAFPHVP